MLNGNLECQAFSVLLFFSFQSLCTGDNSIFRDDCVEIFSVSNTVGNFAVVPVDTLEILFIFVLCLREYSVLCARALLRYLGRTMIAYRIYPSGYHLFEAN